MTYMVMPTNSDLLHYGVSAKDGAPGRGSGRYPLGSGKGGQKDKSGYRSYGEDADENRKIAKKNAKRAIDFAASQSNLIDNKTNKLKDHGLNYETRKNIMVNAKKQFDIASDILGPKEIDKIARNQKIKTMAMTAGLGASMYAAAIALMPPSVMVAPVGIPISVAQVGGQYTKGTKYLKG